MSQLQSFLDIPEEERHILIRQIEHAWSRGRPTEAKNIDTALNLTQEIVGYSLRMFWLGRKDKLNEDSIKAFDWITKNIVKERLDNNENYHELSYHVINEIWSLYTATPNNGLPQPITKKFSLKKFFK